MKHSDRLKKAAKSAKSLEVQQTRAQTSPIFQEDLLKPIRDAIIASDRHGAEAAFRSLLLSRKGIQLWTEALTVVGLKNNVMLLVGMFRDVTFTTQIQTACIHIQTHQLWINPVFFLRYVKSWGHMLFLLLHEKEHGQAYLLYGWVAMLDAKARGWIEDIWANTKARRLVLPQFDLSKTYYCDPDPKDKDGVSAWKKSLKNSRGMVLAVRGDQELWRKYVTENGLEKTLEVAFKREKNSGNPALVGIPSIKEWWSAYHECLGPKLDYERFIMLMTVWSNIEFSEEQPPALGDGPKDKAKQIPLGNEPPPTEEEKDQQESPVKADGEGGKKDESDEDGDSDDADDEDGDDEEDDSEESDDEDSSEEEDGEDEDSSEDDESDDDMEEEDVDGDDADSDDDDSEESGDEEGEGEDGESGEGGKEGDAEGEADPDVDGDAEGAGGKNKSAEDDDSADDDVDGEGGSSEDPDEDDDAEGENSADDGEDDEAGTHEREDGEGEVDPKRPEDMEEKPFYEWDEPVEMPNVEGKGGMSSATEDSYEEGAIREQLTVPVAGLGGTQFNYVLIPTNDPDNITEEDQALLDLAAATGEANNTTFTFARNIIYHVDQHVVGGILAARNKTEQTRTTLFPSTITRRTAQFLASGYIPPFYEYHVEDPPPLMDVYIDVSGSMSAYYVLISRLAKMLAGHIGEVYQFSTDLVVVDPQDNRLFTTGGTDYNIVARQILESGATEVVVLSDNTCEISPDLYERLGHQLRRLVLISTGPAPAYMQSRKGFNWLVKEARNFPSLEAEEVMLPGMGRSQNF